MNTKLRLSSAVAEETSQYRTIDFNSQVEAEYNHKTNQVFTAYNSIFFLIPKTLIEEFRNLSYFWFLTTGFLDFFLNTDFFKQK